MNDYELLAAWEYLLDRAYGLLDAANDDLHPSDRDQLATQMAGLDLAYTIEWGSLESPDGLEWSISGSVDEFGTRHYLFAKNNRTTITLEMRD
jgi:hypothetical protein